MKKLVLMLMMAAAVVSSVAQQKGPILKWDSATHDFGDLKEADGEVTHKFVFVNEGTEPLVITNVHPSCGCTTADYTKSPVMPGKSGYVSATYDPSGRPGPFKKTITVTTNCVPQTSIIRISGQVLEREKTLAELHPRQIGELNVETNHIAFLSVKNTNTGKSDTMSMVNLTEKPLTITFDEVPAHITMKAVPETLQPNQTGKLIAIYDATKRNDWGFMMDKVYLTFNGEKSKKNVLSISATIEEDFSTLSAQQLADAPAITFTETEFNFGTIKQGDKVSHTFTFSNTGKSDLLIRKVMSSCGCTVAKTKVDVLKPGESTDFEVTFNSAGKRNRQNKTITIISNDPNKSKVVLRIFGDVKEGE